MFFPDAFGRSRVGREAASRICAQRRNTKRQTHICLLAELAAHASILQKAFHACKPQRKRHEDFSIRSLQIARRVARTCNVPSVAIMVGP